MKTILYILLIFILSCTGGADEQASSTNKTKGSNKDSQDIPTTYTSVTSQLFAQTQNQVGFDLMPLTNSGEPIGCEDSELKFEVKKYHNGEITEEDQSISVKCITNQPSKVGLIIDNSGSVRNYRLIIENSVNTLLEQLLSIGSQVSLVEVNTNARVLTPLTNDKEVFQKSMSNMLNKGGWTSLYDGIRMSHDTLNDQVVYKDENDEACQIERKAIIVLTDGVENNSSEQNYESYDLKTFPGDKINTSIDDLKKMRDKERRIPIYTLGIGDEISDNILESLSSDSGASYQTIPHYNQVESAFKKIGNYLKSPHRVCIQSQDMKCGEHKVVVDYSSANGPSGSTEVNFKIACPGEEKIIAEEEQTEETTETISNIDDIENNESRELDLIYNKEVVYPLFDDENGKRELVEVNLHFEANKQLDLSLEEKTQFERISSFDIYDADRKIIKLTKQYNQSEETSLVFQDKQKLEGVYKVASHFYSNFIGSGFNKVLFEARDHMEWQTEKKVSGTLKIEGNFVIEYIWRFKIQPGVVIPDSELRLAVRNATGIRVGVITPEAMAQITELSLNDKQISTFQGIEYATALTSLKINNTGVRDISFLKHTPLLKTLDISKNPLSDYSILTTLKNLEKLLITDTNFSDINIIKSIANIIELNISRTDVINISALSNLKSLSKLTMQSSNVTNFYPIGTIENLKSLDIQGSENNPATTINFKDDHVYDYIHAGYSNLSNIDRFLNKNIYTLNISGNALTSVEKISEIPYLRTIYAYTNKLGNDDLTLMIQLPNIRTINVSNNLITNLNINTENNSLRTLYINSNKISEIEQVIKVPNLTKLNISGTSISSFSIVSKLEKLESLYAQRLQINDLSPLKENLALKYLDVRYNDLSETEIDFSSFQSLESLLTRNSNSSNISFIKKENISQFDFRDNSMTCEIQKQFVEKQYDGFNIKYDNMASCPYQYITGGNITYLELNDIHEIGFQFFGEFDNSQYIEEMYGEHEGSFIPVELNSGEVLEGMQFKFNIDLIMDINNISSSNIETNIQNEFKIKFYDGDEVFYETGFEQQMTHNLKEDTEKGQVAEQVEKTYTLDKQVVDRLSNLEKVVFVIEYRSKPVTESNLEAAFNIDNRSTGEVKVIYNIAKQSK